MKRKLNRLLAMGLTVTMVAAVSACGGNDGGEKNAAANEKTEETAANDKAEDKTEEKTDDTATEEAKEEAKADDGEKYDFGGVTIKCYGGQWGNLSSEDQFYQDAKAEVEEKYNVKLELAEMEGYDGTNDDDLIVSSVAAGDPCVDMIVLNPESSVTCFTNGLLYDISNYLDELQVGSVYTNAATWQGKCYGVSYDNIGDTWVLVYDRDYLQKIGMEKTPTEMFMEGKWDYANFEAYLTEMKSKLPDDVYPIGNYPYHWATMASGANGVSFVDSTGKIKMLEDPFVEAINEYKNLLDAGLAYPESITGTDDEGNPKADIAYAVDDERIVLKRAEAWQLEGLDFNYGIVYWPWGSNVTCDGDYKTLSENYQVDIPYWGFNSVVAASCDKLGISGEMMTKIADDYFNACDDYSFMHEAYEAEQKGDNVNIGKEYGEARSFYTDEDIELYDWGHERSKTDYAWALTSAELIDCWTPFEDIYLTGTDVRSTLESYYNEFVPKMTDAGLAQ